MQFIQRLWFVQVTRRHTQKLDYLLLTRIVQWLCSIVFEELFVKVSSIPGRRFVLYSPELPRSSVEILLWSTRPSERSFLVVCDMNSSVHICLISERASKTFCSVVVSYNLIGSAFDEYFWQLRYINIQSRLRLLIKHFCYVLHLRHARWCNSNDDFWQSLQLLL